MKTAYTAMLTPMENGGGYYASIPDLKGCVTTGTNLPDAMEQIRDALSVYLLALEDAGDPLPEPRLPDQFAPQKGVLYSLIDVDTIEYRKATDTAAVRKNVTIPSWMAYRADKLNINVSNVLQNALERTFRRIEKEEADDTDKQLQEAHA
ncbi:MAG: type II toxin-antitoxin system HicB family antitoxin [Eubacteriales bacterium]|nr:type II toxin-antitoxin system HicB family antitoxin [Eubacteriales bacterium]